MKFKIKKKIRMGLISILVILIALISYLLFNEINNPGVEEQEKSIYEYSNKATANYKVHLKPNNLYKGTTMEEGQMYITEFVDQISTNFNYNLTGESPAEITGKYSVSAQVSGFINEGEKKINVWVKDFPLIVNKNIISSDGTLTIKENIKLNLNEYNTFVTEIKEASKLTVQSVLTLKMDVEVKGTTEKGTFEEMVSPNLTIPLNVSMFEISGNSNVDNPGSIDETIMVQLPVDKKQVILYGVILGILCVLAIFMLVFTKGITAIDPLEKELKKIIKKHGDRLVALIYDIDVTSNRSVRSFEDLVRISDEMGKPILYKYNENFREIEKFYVTNEDEIYMFDLKDFLPKDEFDDLESNDEEKISEEETADSEE